MKLDYSEPAIQDLKRLREFIEEHNPAAARRIAGELLDQIQTLPRFPNLGKTVSHPAAPDGMRDLVVSRRYIVRYQLFGESILILRVWHQKEERPDA